MKKIILFAAFVIYALSLSAQDDKVFVKDANAQPRTLSGSFTGVSVSGSVDLYLSQSDEEVVVVSAATPELRDRIVTEIKDGVLEIYFKDKGFKWTRDKKLKAYVSFKTLNKLRASGSSDIYANGVIKSSALQLTLSGASDFKGAIDVQELSINQSGSSDSQISGRADKVNILVSGASDVKGYDLITDYCEANASGASDIQLTVNKEINAVASGSSDISYKGSATVSKVISSGSSSVKKSGK